MLKRNILLGLIAIGGLLLAACAGSSGFSKIGEHCDGSTGSVRCNAGLVCAHDGTCQDPGSGSVGEAAQGEACSSTNDCGYGLVCGFGNICIVGGVTAQGEGCGGSENCQFGLICGSSYVCARPGSGVQGSDCLGGEECVVKLVCAADGTCQDPDNPDVTGVSGPGEDCENTGDCRLGLVCYLDGTCKAPEFWAGLDCSQSQEAEKDEAYPFKFYFEVPRLGEVSEFYRLPFPNDIRVVSGKVSLRGHPAPDTPMAGGLINKYLTAIEAEMTGFSTQATVYMRSSKWIDFGTIMLSGDNPNFYMKNISPESPGYGEGASIAMFATTGRGKYICHNWLALKPMDGVPLRHSTTYALFATKGILSDAGAAPERDDDFEVMMSDTPPVDSVMVQAWTAYQPLRDYLNDTDMVEVGYKNNVMAAAVFTTMDPDSVMAGFRDKIRNCSGADCSYLQDATPLAMNLEVEESLYYVVNGMVDIPVFQEGSPPYQVEGGGVMFDDQGAPIIQRSESVAFTLSVPKGTPPADGWPVVLYAHGTGGSSHSFIQNSVAENLAQTEVTIDTTTTTVNFAVLGIEGVQHGDRRGGSAVEPNLLYFNFLNPAAAKYNAVQGAADNFQLIRLVESLNTTPVAVSGIGDPVKLDSSKIYYFGHSQGSMTGPLFLVYSPAAQSAVLSGAGGNLIQSLLTKTEPVDIAGATRLILGDPYVGSMHPMLNLFQLYFDPVDTVNYAAALTYSPLVIGETQDVPPEPIYAGPKNIFMSFGRDDHYSSEETMTSFSRAMAVVQVTDAGQDCTCDDSCDALDQNGLHQALCVVMGLATGSTPLRGNAWANGTAYTAALKMYLADGYDGHFVLFNHAQAADDYAGFLGSALADSEEIPTLFP